MTKPTKMLEISAMASKVGYGTFLTEHVLFGLALGVLLAHGGCSPVDHDDPITDPHSEVKPSVGLSG